MKIHSFEEKRVMSKPIQAINRYKADLREMNFLLWEQFKLDEVLGQSPYDGWGVDEMKTALSECYKFCRDVIGPLNPVGDARCCSRSRPTPRCSRWCSRSPRSTSPTSRRSPSASTARRTAATSPRRSRSRLV